MEQARRLEELRRALDRLADQVGVGEELCELRRDFARWLHRVVVPRRFPDAKAEETESLEEFRTMLEKRVKQWEEELLEVGREEGREEGALAGQARTLLLQMQLRFGDLAPEHRERLAAAGPDELDTWLARILTADSPDQVFDG